MLARRSMRRGVANRTSCTAASERRQQALQRLLAAVLVLDQPLFIALPLRQLQELGAAMSKRAAAWAAAALLLCSASAFELNFENGLQGWEHSADAKYSGSRFSLEAPAGLAGKALKVRAWAAHP